jgi:3-oxoacyl-[acyl-carrier protein] reductase
MDLGLKDRVALVTGSSRGIGRALGLRFAQEGAHVAITYRQRKEAAEQVAETVRGFGVEALVFPFDLESEESPAKLAEAVKARFGRIDVLVNNAVATKVSPRQGSTFDWDLLVRTNIEGTHRLIQAVVPAMRSNRWGRILNVSSGLAVDGRAGFSWYTTAKSALHGMTRSLAQEFGPWGILVNVVMPGLTSTEEQPANISQRHRENVAANLPIRRLPTPDEVAEIITFLCSEKNSIVTGEIVRASGG